VPSYIAHIRPGEPAGQSRFRPGETPTYTAHDGGTQSAGEQFLAQFPIEELLEHLAVRNPLIASYLQGRPQRQPHSATFQMRRKARVNSRVKGRNRGS
jgi:hypothetical protein